MSKGEDITNKTKHDVLSNEEMREPIENALYASKRFLTTQATELAEDILDYLKDAGFTIVRNTQYPTESNKQQPQQNE